MTKTQSTRSKAKLDPSAANIVRLYREATPQQLADGLDWYQAAHSAARALSPDDVLKGAGVIAALSPLKDWDINLRLAITAFADGAASGHMGPNCAWADRIMAGESVDDVLNGPKTNNFAHVIANPTHPTAVVVDRHAFDVAVGKVTDDKTRGQLARKGEYDRFANAYREAAEIVGVSPSQVQAVAWVVWRLNYSEFRAANNRALAAV
jgi:hypothetical protein